MSHYIFVGIDPGLRGGLWYYNNRSKEEYGIRFYERLDPSTRFIWAIKTIKDKIESSLSPALLVVGIEKYEIRPGQNPSDSAKTVWQNGYIHGYFSEIADSVYTIPSKEWYKGLNINNRDLSYPERKKRNRDLARETQPGIHSELADAYLIRLFLEKGYDELHKSR